MKWKSLLIVLLTGSLAQAQPEPEVTGDKLLLPITLTPNTYPKPVSKSYLLPEYAETQPGSKVQGFLKCFMEQQVFFGHEQDMKRHKFLEMTLADLPADVRQQCGIYDGIAYDTPGARLMGFMDRAARYNRTEWNEWFDLRKDGVYYLLPEVQKLRSISAVLRLRMRGEIKNGEFSRAIVTTRTIFGLAQALEEHPTLIGNLVGLAIANQAINALEEMIQQPGCPNMFWAFADLPTHIIDIRKGISGERTFITSQIEPLTKAQHILSDKELEKILKYIEELIQVGNTPDKGVVEKIMANPRVRYAQFASDAKRVEEARKRIIASGFPEDVAKTLPAMQVVLHDDHLQYEIHRDELLKWSNVPVYQAREGIAETEKRLKQLRPEVVLAPNLVAGSWRVQETMARTDQRIAYLKTLEAIRLHAYDNKGQLPATLSDIKLPLSNDPLTGKPFVYTVNGEVATLSGGNTNPANARNNRVYEIRLKK
jgi:hypothetical protein